MSMDASEIRMNVAALKRVDPYVKDILETATHVALYTFNNDNNEWEKTEIEGALFVYSRIGEPYHSILIMNRLNTKNQVEPVTAGLDLQLQEPFLLYKNTKGCIYGIWFYDKDDCVRISEILNKLVRESLDTTANKQINTPKNTKKSAAQQRKQNNVDIFSMLSKAQEDYNSNKSVSTPAKQQPQQTQPSQHQKVLRSPMSNAIGELSGAINAMSMTQDVTSKSVMDFFAQAKVNTGHYQEHHQQHITTTSTNIINEVQKPLMARLMSHPAAHTLEHIEKQQRAITPQPTLPPQPQVLMIPPQLKKQSDRTPNSVTSKIKSSGGNKMQGKDYLLNSPGMVCPDYGQNSNNLNCSTGINTSGFLRIQSPGTINAKNIMNQQKAKQNSADYVANMAQAFAARTTTNVCDDMITLKQTDLAPNEATPALIPPGMFAAPSPVPTEPLLNAIEPLTRNQLLQAFNYLLRTDPEFMNKLHEAYVKSFSEILS